MRIRNWHTVAKRPERIKVECIGSSGPQCTVVPEEEEVEEEGKGRGKRRRDIAPLLPHFGTR